MCLILAMTPSFLVNGASDALRRSAERGDVGLHDEVLLGGRHVDLDRLWVHRGAAEQQEDDTERGVPEHRHDFLLPRKVNGRIRATAFSVKGSAGSGKKQTARTGPRRSEGCRNGIRRYSDCGSRERSREGPKLRFSTCLL